MRKLALAIALLASTAASAHEQWIHLDTGPTYRWDHVLPGPPLPNVITVPLSDGYEQRLRQDCERGGDVVVWTEYRTFRYKASPCRADLPR